MRIQQRININLIRVGVLSLCITLLTCPTLLANTTAVRNDLTGDQYANMPLSQLEPILRAACPDQALYMNSRAPTGKIPDCKAAWDAYLATSANKSLSLAWTAVASVCAVGCIASMAVGGVFVPPAALCYAGATMAGAADLMTSKATSDTMLTVMGVGVALYGASTLAAAKPKPIMDPAKPAGFQAPVDDAGKAIPERDYSTLQQNRKFEAETRQANYDRELKNADDARDAQKAQAKKVDKVVCGTAAITAFLAYNKNSESDKARQSLNSNLAIAVGAGAATAAGVLGPQAAAAVANTQPGNANKDPAVTPAPVLPASAGACAQAGAATGANQAQLVLNCAVESDPRIPPEITSPRFADQFKQTTGQNLGSAINNAANNTVGGAVAAAVESGIPGAKAEKLAHVIDHPAAMDNGPVPSSKYASGGGSGNQGGGGGPADGGIGDMMNQMMQNLGGGKKATEADPQAGTKAVIFANEQNQRNPDAITEDKSLSIFDRITYRYYYATVARIYPSDEPKPAD